MWLFHLIQDRKQMTLITLLASVESIVLWHPRAELSKYTETEQREDSKKHTANLQPLKAIVQVEVEVMTSQPASDNTRTSGACIALPCQE